MLIKTSKTLVIIGGAFLFFVATFLPIWWLIPTLITTTKLILIPATFSVVGGILFELIANIDIEVVERELMIGGTGIYEKHKLPMFRRFKKRQFVFRQSIDVNKSLRRSYFDRRLGIYKIYDINGRGFKIYRYCFSKEAFKEIKEKINRILGIQL